METDKKQLVKQIKKNLFAWMLVVITVLIGGVSVLTARLIQGGAIPFRSPFAWDCSSYNFLVDQNGVVSVMNDSRRNERSQYARVYINDVRAATFYVPYLSVGQGATLGTVDVPNGGFAWRVDGTKDCSDSGSYPGELEACELNIQISISTPTPTIKVTSTPTSTPTLTPTPASVCAVEFDLPDTAVCWYDERANVPVSYRVLSLPSIGGPYYVQTDWYVALPTPGEHHYQVVGPVYPGYSGTIYADWPGVEPGQTQTSENHYGINIVNSSGNPVFDNCSDGMDYYWTPYVCPAPTPTTFIPSPTPTPVPAYCPWWYRWWGRC